MLNLRIALHARRWILLGAPLFFVTSALILTGCDDLATSPPDGPAPILDAANAETPTAPAPGVLLPAEVLRNVPAGRQAPECGETHSVVLVAGQHIAAGTVSVSNDGDTMTVTYESTDGWSLDKTHLAVASSVHGIPGNPRGHPQINQFPFKSTHDSGTTTHSYTLLLSDLEFELGQDVVVAAHADVQHPSFGSEAAWGDGIRFVERGPWAMYFGYTLQECTEGPGDFVLFTTDRFIGADTSTWLPDREAADAYCAAYAAQNDIVGSDFRIVYSTPDEDARDFLAYDATRGDRVFSRNGLAVGGDDLWDGGPVSLLDVQSWTITSTGANGRFTECAGSFPSGSWPLCQYCSRKFACAAAGTNPYQPGGCCWTGIRAITCMGRL